MLVRHLTEKNVPLYPTAAAQAPLRVLVGAYMPAVLLEMGFLTNADDELALGGAQLSGDIVEAVLASIADVRFGFPPQAGTDRP
jgi:N-acetylmuramoyl-L-alanine amidase